MANEAQRQSWAEQGLDWVDNAAIFEAVLKPFADAVIRAADLQPGLRVLDVGCGFGTLLERAADAEAVPFGVDISEPMVRAARLRVPSATVTVADAQTADLPATVGGAAVDRVVSRFGVMFFDDPVAAFANIRSAAAPGARLAFVCWRAGDNPMFSVGNSMLAARLESPPTALDPNAPGPLALGEADRTRTILTDAGWAGVELTAFDGICDYRVHSDDGVEERLTMILASTLGAQARTELVERLGEQGWATIVDELREELRANRVDGVLKFPGHTWVVTATNPG